MPTQIEPPGGGRACCDCKEWQEAEQFTWQKSKTCPSRMYRGVVCRKCRCRRSKEWRLKNPEWHRECALRRHGITLREYESILADQGGTCAICRLPESKNFDPRTQKHRNLVVDHDHTTGQVRGLLCSNCNRGLGMFEDEAEILQAAAEYLKRSSQAITEENS